jgi:hypothetical protein
MISIHLKKHFEYVKHNIKKGAKLINIMIFENAISWAEKLYNILAYYQIKMRNVKRLQEWTSYVATHTISEEKVSFLYLDNPWNMTIIRET